METLLNAFRSSVDTIQREFQNEYKRIQENISNVLKFNIDPTEGFSSEDFSESISEAIEIAQDIGENPVISMIEREFAEEYGISTTSALSIAQSLLKGEASPAVKVAAALYRLPLITYSFLSTCKSILDIAEKFVNRVEDVFPEDVQVSTRISISPETIRKLENVRNQLAFSLVYPYNAKQYADSVDELAEAIKEVEKLQWLKGSTFASNAIITLTNAFAMKARPLEKLIDQQAAKIIENLNIIMMTNIAESERDTSKQNMARKALNRISNILAQMKNNQLEQVSLLPKYILILNTCLYILKNNRPIFVKPLDIDRSKIAIRSDTVRNAQRYCRKLVLFFKHPTRISDIKNTYFSLRESLETLQRELERTDIAGVIALGFEGVYNSVSAALKLLEESGATAAIQFIETGDLARFGELKSVSGINYINDLLEIASFIDKVGLYSVSAHIRQMTNKIISKIKWKGIKKKPKRSQLSKYIKDVNKATEDLLELANMVQSVYERLQ